MSKGLLLKHISVLDQLRSIHNMYALPINISEKYVNVKSFHLSWLVVSEILDMLCTQII